MLKQMFSLFGAYWLIKAVTVLPMLLVMWVIAGDLFLEFALEMLK